MASDLVVGGVLALTAAYHAAVILAAGSPSGLDLGNWLYFGHQILGDPVAQAPTTYPPLVPVLSVVLVGLFGPLWADAVLMSVAGTIPALGLYVASRLGGIGWAAIPAVALLALTGSTGEAIAWGGAPQLIGLGLAVIALALGVRLGRQRRLTNAARLSAVVFTIALTSHLILAQLAVTATILIIVVAVADRPDLSAPTWRGRDGWPACIAVIALPLAALVPLYLRLSSTAAGTVDTGRTPRGLASFEAFGSNLWSVYREAPWVWKTLLILALASPVATLAARRRNLLWPLTTAMVLAMVVQALVSSQERIVYFAPIVVGCAIVLATDELVRLRARPGKHRRLVTAVLGALVVAAVYPTIQGARLFPAQRDFYGAFVPKGTVEALDWLRANTNSDEVVLAAPIDGAPFGWWVQGYGRRPTIVTSRDRWLNFPSERERARQGVALLSTPDPLDEATLAAARRLGIDYLVLPWTWGGLTHRQVAEFDRSFPGSVLFDNDALVVIEVPR